MCTHHVQQKQGLIHLIYTMHRALFTWDIPTEGLRLVFQCVSDRTELHILSFSLWKAKWINSGTMWSEKQRTDSTGLIYFQKRGASRIVHLLPVFTCLIQRRRRRRRGRRGRTGFPGWNKSNCTFRKCWKSPKNACKTCTHTHTNDKQTQLHDCCLLFRPSSKKRTTSSNTHTQLLMKHLNASRRQDQTGTDRQDHVIWRTWGEITVLCVCLCVCVCVFATQTQVKAKLVELFSSRSLNASPGKPKMWPYILQPVWRETLLIKTNKQNTSARNYSARFCVCFSGFSQTHDRLNTRLC